MESRVQRPAGQFPGLVSGMPASRYVIGIDLGTTNCAFSYIDTKSADSAGGPRSRVLPIHTARIPGCHVGEPTLPSFLYLSAAGKRALYRRCLRAKSDRCSSRKSRSLGKILAESSRRGSRGKTLALGLGRNHATQSPLAHRSQRPVSLPSQRSLGRNFRREKLPVRPIRMSP